ncbi:MAG TPA: M42 family peptidase [Gemmatimonadota bacterium]|nr:M42 family peptidase [Gemmatimonadota bacterium]
MNETMREFLTRLLDAYGPSGYEGAPARVWREEARSFADEVWLDVQGNSFAAAGPEDAPTIMLAGHIDEIGLMVHHIDEKGYLFVQAVGGWDPQVLVGQRVSVLGGEGVVPGVVGRKAIHLIDRDERDKAVKLKDLWIDIGARDRDEALARVQVGDVAVLAGETVELANDRFAARSIDDRIGTLVALEALRRVAGESLNVRVVAVATTQEEIGYRSGGGAATSSFGVAPDAAIAIDVTHATDHPSVDRKEHGDVDLGGGPVLSRGAVVNAVLYRLLTEAAGRAGIEIQVHAAPSGTGTDADSIYTARTGVATAVVSVPNRYMHSPSQMVAASDVEGASELIATLLLGLSGEESFLPE